MAGGWLPDVLHRLRQRLAAADDGMADADLLDRFLARRDEAAFETLVGRHGAMVLGVCGRVLGDAHATEDAFQATFLILVRRARAIRKRASLGSWLHGVAYRAALKARAREACRRRHEREAMRSEPIDPARDVVWRDLRPALDAALDRLPEKYRAPLVLCYLEGKTQQEAARLLGWRLGTLATCVLRGRARLHAILTRRGVGLSAAGLSVALARDAASAEAPAALVRATVSHAASVAAGPAAAVAVPVSIQVLVTGVLHTMRWVRIGKAVLAAAAAVLVGGAALLWQQGHARATVADPTAEREPAAVRVAQENQGDRADGNAVLLAQGNQADQKAQGDQAAGDKDLESLKGTWNVETMVWGDKSLPRELMKGYKFVFAGNKLTWDAAIGMMSRGGKISATDGAFSCDFKLDPSKNPKHIDITLHMKQRDATLLGIYELKGDALKVCYYASDTGKRPPDFVIDATTPRVGCITLTRAKKADTDQKAQGDQAASDKDLESLKGTWNVETMGWGDKSLPRELMKGYKFVFAGNKLTWDAAIGMMSKGGKISAIDGALQCDFTIDASKKPKHIDITLHMKKRDATLLGIYELKGDALKVCYYASDTGKRPTEFAIDETTPRVGCITLTRAKKADEADPE